MRISSLWLVAGVGIVGAAASSNHARSFDKSPAHVQHARAVEAEQALDKRILGDLIGSILDPILGLITKPLSIFTCNGSGQDGFLVDWKGNRRPSWAPDGFEWYGKSGWQPKKGWECGSDWTVPKECDLTLATWWQPTLAWKAAHIHALLDFVIPSHWDFQPYPAKGWTCSGNGKDGWDLDDSGSKPPSFAVGWKWFGFEGGLSGWAPPVGWSCSEQWLIPSPFKLIAHKVLWWQPTAAWKKYYWSYKFDWCLPAHWGMPGNGCSAGTTSTTSTRITTTTRPATTSAATTTTTTSAPPAVTTPADDKSGNLARKASVTASSERDDSLAVAVIDGKIGGYLADGTGVDSQEWSTYQEGAGAWIQLTWKEEQTFNQIALFDRPNLDDQILTGYVIFADGTGVSFGALDNAGSAYWINLASTVKTTSLRVVVTKVLNSVWYQNTGLSEIEVYLADTNEFPSGSAIKPSAINTAAPTTTTSQPTTTTTTSAAATTTPADDKSGNLARKASVTASSERDDSLAVAVIDGKIGGYLADGSGVDSQEWSTYQEGAGAWIQLTWAKEQTFNQIALFDRPNLDDQILSGYVIFADGTGVSFGALDNAGSAYWINLASTVKTTSLRVVVTKVLNSVWYQNTGLSEIEVYLADTNEFPSGSAIKPSKIDTSVPSSTSSSAVSTTTQAPSTTTTSEKPTQTSKPWPGHDWQCNGSGNDGWEFDYDGNTCPSNLGGGKWLWFGSAIGWAPAKGWSISVGWSPSALELTNCGRVNWWLPPVGLLIPGTLKCPLNWTFGGWIDKRRPSADFKCDGSGEDGFDLDFNGNGRPDWTEVGWRWYGKDVGFQPCKGWELPSSSWKPSRSWDARGATWWAPNRTWVLTGNFLCPTWWRTTFLKGIFAFW
ncbi:hypothetical protein JCM6882_003998 [Rhodosporidiobolus microsporus]